MIRVNKKYLVDKQYRTADNFKIRSNLHRYGINKTPFWPWVRDKYPIFPGNKILEVGCGLGTFWKEVYQTIPKTCEITLSDISPGMITASQETLKEYLLSKPILNFEVTDIENLSYPAAHFDLIIAHFMLYHADSPEKALLEIKKVLKENGHVGIMLPSKNNMQKLFDLLTIENPIQAQNFSSEIALSVLPNYFSTIQTYSNENMLQIDSTEAIVNYIKTLSTMDQKSKAFYKYCKTLLEKYIQQEGFLLLPIQQLLFVVSC